jgi:hypothetical protein
MATVSKLGRVLATAFLACAGTLAYQASAQDASEPVSRRPVDEREYVLIKGSLSNGTPGCLALAPDGSVRFIEKRPVGKEISVGLGYDCIWNISGALSTAAGKYVALGDNGTLAVRDKRDDKLGLLFLYIGERGPGRKIKIVLRDTERKVDYTLKFERKSELVSNKDETDSIRTHRVVAIEGHGGDEFKFEGFSK